jgi:GT2 family glycosyltransferase
MTLPPVSVVIASRHRPALLQRALTALTQQDHPQIEVIVVADPVAAEQVRARGLPVTVVPFDMANVAAARNAGIVLAGAEVVAFLDDDAVPEPTWARRLAEPFADDRVMQAGGYVRGRNGISFQWRALAVDATGRDHPLDLPDTVTLHAGSAQWAIKTQGTNCAFRRSALLAAGGFDPAFRFYLDDADLNLRMAAKGGLTAVVPRAEVHHGFAASDRRRADRTPRTLQDIGASSAVFLRRHAPGHVDLALDDLRRAQRRRLLAGLQDGRLEPRDVARLMATLEQGIAEGRAQQHRQPVPLVPTGQFRQLSGTGLRRGVVLSGPSWTARLLAQRAAKVAAEGAVVTVLVLGALPRRHRMWFDPAGYWWQEGGIGAPSCRSDPVWRAWGRQARTAREAARLRPVRPIMPDDPCLSAQQRAPFEAPTGLFSRRKDIESEMSYRVSNSSLDRQRLEAYESNRRAQYAAC